MCGYPWRSLAPGEPLEDGVWLCGTGEGSPRENRKAQDYTVWSGASPMGALSLSLSKVPKDGPLCFI